MSETTPVRNRTPEEQLAAEAQAQHTPNPVQNPETAVVLAVTQPATFEQMASGTAVPA